MTDKNIKIGAEVNNAGFKKLEDTLKKTRKETESFQKTVKGINTEFKAFDKEINNRVKFVEKLAGAFKQLRTAMTSTGIHQVPGIAQGGPGFNNGQGAARLNASAYGGPVPQMPHQAQPPVINNNMGGGAGGPGQGQGYGRRDPFWIKTGNALRAGGEITDYLRDMNTLPESGLAQIAGVRNRMFDRIMGHDISDSAAMVYNTKNLGKDRHIRSQEMIKSAGAGAISAAEKVGGVAAGKAVAEGFEKYLETSSKVGDMIGANTKVQSFSELAGRTTIQNISALIGAGTQVADAASMSKAGGGTAVQILDAAAGLGRHVEGYGDWVRSSEMAEKQIDNTKAVNHQDIAMMQNFVNKAGMILQGDLRMGGRGIRAMGRGAGQGMMGEEAISYGIGVNDRFGQAMGDPLMQYGLGRRAKGGNAGLMAQLAGTAGFGIGGTDSNDAKTQRGIKILTEAISLGVEKGLKDPQSMEALSQAIAGSVAKFGGTGGLMSQYLTSGMNAGNFNPLLVEERQRALTSFSGAEGANPYFRSMALASANQQLGSGASYVSTQALGGSLEELFGMAGSEKAKALGISDDQIKSQITNRMATVLTGAAGGNSKQSQKLKAMIGNAKTSEDIIDNVLNSEGGAALAAALTEGNFMGDFKTNFNFLQGLKLKGGSLRDMDLRDMNSAAKGVQQTMAGADMKFITELLGDKEKSQTFKETLRAFTAMQEALLKNPFQAGQEESVVKVMSAIESLVKRIIEAGGADAVVKAANNIELNPPRNGKPKPKP